MQSKLYNREKEQRVFGDRRGVEVGTGVENPQVTAVR